MSTIAAIATPRGAGGIGVIRVSGPDALRILKESARLTREPRDKFAPWKMRHAIVMDENGERLDEVLAVYMPGPRSFTGEDIAEIHCHGGAALVDLVLRAVLSRGARPAERGEFSKRAFLNGRIDIIQAEAIAELIASPSRAVARDSFKRLRGHLGERIAAFRAKTDELRALAQAGVDFPDDEIPSIENEEFITRLDSIIDDIEGLLRAAARSNALRTGASVMLAGPVNAGKSSLLNALSSKNRALVTDIPGTTRDFIEENIIIDDLPLRLLDTAGFRDDADSTDPVESLGIEKSRELAREEDLILLIIDLSAKTDPEKYAALDKELRALSGRDNIIVVYNKLDLLPPDFQPPQALVSRPSIAVSAKSGENIDELATLIKKTILGDLDRSEDELAPNSRQSLALTRARDELVALRDETLRDLTWDCRLSRLDAASEALDEVVGLAGREEMLDKIFSQFCVGK
ncbi:MAG: tRNA uridine-5-carboxymethylaminomethyl(34) synthesis GTPase MnmE [Desulfovibrio sp.]|nr:tRNA uridine-5-carboxymethylaminomethyl(34) synthesis GTPase MnmE [Desulfovibrio sp.]